MRNWLWLPAVLALAGWVVYAENQVPDAAPPPETLTRASATPDPAPAAVVPATNEQVKLSYAPVVKAVSPSVVNIYARVVVQSSPFSRDPFYSQLFGNLRSRPQVQNALGSGVIVGDDGIVVSNYHVVGKATDIRVALADRREYDAEILLADEDTDLAILRLKDAPALPGLQLADSDTAEVGDLVLAIGNPFGVGQTVSSGIVSALARTSTIQGREGYFIQTDAPINPGNSGGALVDMTGRLVGINSAILSRSGGSNGIGFAIPANLVRQYVDQAAAGNEAVRRPWAGLSVQAVDYGTAEALGLEVPHGVLVSSLHPASPFAAAGITVGDVITTIDGQPVDGEPELRFRLLTRGVGGAAQIGYLHDGVQEITTLDLVTAPEDPPRDEVLVDARSILNGLSVANLNPALADELDLPDSVTGVVVTGVDGVAQRTRLRRGDVLIRINGSGIEAPGDVADLAAADVAGYEIEFQRGGQRAAVRIRNY